MKRVPQREKYIPKQFFHLKKMKSQARNYCKTYLAVHSISPFSSFRRAPLYTRRFTRTSLVHVIRALFRHPNIFCSPSRGWYCCFLSLPSAFVIRALFRHLDFFVHHLDFFRSSSRPLLFVIPISFVRHPPLSFRHPGLRPGIQRGQDVRGGLSGWPGAELRTGAETRPYILN